MCSTSILTKRVGQLATRWGFHAVEQPTDVARAIETRHPDKEKFSQHDDSWWRETATTGSPNQSFMISPARLYLPGTSLYCDVSIERLGRWKNCRMPVPVAVEWHEIRPAVGGVHCIIREDDLRLRLVVGTVTLLSTAAQLWEAGGFRLLFDQRSGSRRGNERR
jgi:hypothetical protein